MSVLFPKLLFQHDETPMSWAARQAAFHMGMTAVPFLNALQIPAADLACGKREAVERLCILAGQDSKPVLRNTIEALGERRYRLRDCEFSAEFTTGVVTRFCPLCLKEDQAGEAWPKATMRHRLLWRLAPVRTCRKHNVALVDMRANKWTAMLHEVQVMSETLSEATDTALNCRTRRPSPLQDYVERRLDGEAGPAWLDGQGIDQACRAVEMLGGLICFGPEQKAAGMTEDMWDAASREAWPLVSEGDIAVREFLTKQICSVVKANGCPSPRLSLGMLYGWLYSNRLSKDPGPIRDVVRDVVVENVPLVPGQLLLGQTIANPRLASISSIASAEHLHPKTLTKILLLAGVIDESEPLQGVRNIVADYALAKPLIERAKHATPITRVPDMLSASRPMVSALIELGQLRRIQDHDELKSKVGKAIDGRSIQEVLKFIELYFEVVDEAPAGHVPLAKAAEKTKVTLLAILELLFGRHLKSACRLNAHSGFSAVMVPPSEITKCIQCPPDAVSDEVRFWMP